VIITAGRGGLQVEADILAALDDGTLAAATLDVFATEPLPPESPLWGMDNVLITSHIGGMSDSYIEQVMPIVIENLRAYLAGTPARMRFIIRMPEGLQS
jgi:phosphoglycerate dehydrogenase-like enzyme